MKNLFKTALYPILLLGFLSYCTITNGMLPQLIRLEGEFFNDYNEYERYKQKKKPLRALKRRNSFKELTSFIQKKLIESTNSKKEEESPDEIYKNNIQYFAKGAEKRFLENKRYLFAMPLGSASLFLRLGTKNILINPNFSRPLPVNPRHFIHLLDFVLITDNHNLDAQTFKLLARKNKKVTIFAPQGFRSWLIQKGFKAKKVIELKWWKSYSTTQTTYTKRNRKGFKRNYTFTLLPSHYRSEPKSFAWGSFLIEYSKQEGKHVAIYFAGQTGPSENFHEIAKKYRIGIACFPIASQSNLYKGNGYYMNYANARKAAIKQLGAQIFVPLHSLYDSDYENNVLSLKRKITETGITSLDVPLVGESL